MGYYSAGRVSSGYYDPRAAYGAQGGFLSGIWHAVKDVALPAIGSAFGPAGAAAMNVGRAVLAHPVATAAAGAATAAVVTSAVTRGSTGMPPGAGMTMPGGGVHLHLHRGRAAAAPGVAGYRKRRRMNVCNPHALRRAIRRARGFEHLALKVIGFTRPHGKPKGHPYFKKRATHRK